MEKLRHTFSPLVIAVVLFGCGRGIGPEPQPAVPTTPPEVLRDFLASRRDPGVDPDPTLSPGDVIRIDAEDVSELNGSYTIGRGGAIVVPLVGRIRAAGRKPADLAEGLKRRLQGLVVKPKVEVSVVDLAGRTVLVTGAVEREAPVSLGATGKTLLEALTLAGGFSAEAAGTVRVIPTAPETLQLFADPEAAAAGAQAVEIAAVDLLRGGDDGGLRLYLRPGDVIEVPEGAGARSGLVPVARALKIPPVDRKAEIEAARPESNHPPEEPSEEAQPPTAGALEIIEEPPPLAAKPEPPEEENPPAAEKPLPEPESPGLFASLFGGNQVEAAVKEPEAIPVDLHKAPDAGLISVIGMVERPGRYPIGEVRTVAEAVAIAGKRLGADLAAVEVERRSPRGFVRSIVNVEEVRIGKRSDERLQVGDTITVPGVNW